MVSMTHCVHGALMCRVGGVITAVGSSSYLEEQGSEQKVHGMYYCIPPQ